MKRIIELDVSELGRAVHRVSDLQFRDVEHEMGRLREALGLLTTLKPDLVMNVHDPLGMAKEIELHVKQRDDVRKHGLETAITRIKYYQSLPDVHVFDSDDFDLSEIENALAFDENHLKALHEQDSEKQPADQ